MSGVAAAVKLRNRNCEVYAVEPIGANSMSQSIKVGKPVTLNKIDTIADSLAPPMALPFSYSVCEKFVDQFVTVTDDQICAGLSPYYKRKLSLQLSLLLVLLSLRLSGL